MPEVKRKYEELTHKIIGCAMKVHGQLGSGFQEVIYQRCLVIEFEKTRLNYEREKEIEIFYDGHLVGTRRADFFVESTIIVELKAMKEIEDAHIAQTLNYLEAHNKEVGLLINFGAPSLQFHRFTNKKFKPEPDKSHSVTPET